MDEVFQELNLVAFPEFLQIMQAKEGIHRHYKEGFDRDGWESYHLAREVETLSRHLRSLHRMLPWINQLSSLSDQLKYMGRDLQLGPRRLRYQTIPKMRHDRHRLMWN